MNSRFRSIFFTLMAVGVAGSVAVAKPEGTTLVVIPSRYTVVQFCFDIARIRSVYLVSYDQPATVKKTMLYAWNNEQSNWVPIEASDLAGGTLFTVPPQRTVLVGAGPLVPAAVLDAVTAAGPFSQVESLNLMDLSNALHQSMRFSGSEWKWLAGRYNLQLEDRNEERRRWGRYGAPGQARIEAPASGKPWHAAEMEPDVETLVIMPPAVVSESLTEVPAAPARQTLVIPAATADGSSTAAMWDSSPTTTPAAEKAMPVGAGVAAANTPAPPAAAPMRPEDK